MEIDGEKVFALVQKYETVVMDVPKFETHKKYIDVQYIVSGEEIIGWAPYGQDTTATETYDVLKDICFRTVPKGLNNACLSARPGQWLCSFLKTVMHQD